MGSNIASCPFIDAAGNLNRLNTLNAASINVTTAINTGLATITGSTISTLADNNLILSPNGTGVVFLTTNLNMNANNIFNISAITAALYSKC